MERDEIEKAMILAIQTAKTKGLMHSKYPGFITLRRDEINYLATAIAKSGIPRNAEMNMGAITKEEIEKFADYVLDHLIYIALGLGKDMIFTYLEGWKMEWTIASPSICMREGKIIFIEERYIGQYPWVAKENVLHEVAHIFTDAKGHGSEFYKVYIRLLSDFMLEKI